MKPRRIEIIPGLMAPGINGPLTVPATVSPRRSVMPDGTHPASWCLNLRDSGQGGLQAVHEGLVTGRTEHPVVMADRREDLRSFFTLDDSLGLRIELQEREGEPMSAAGGFIATLPAPLAGYAPVGEFLVLRLTDGRLFYLMWNPDLENYSPLGLLPGFGEIAVEASPQREVTASVAAAKFSAVVADPRSVNLADVAQPTVKAVQTALREAQVQAAVNGCWTQPVGVRLAWRLWDGSLLHLTPLEIPAEVKATNGGRVSLGLTANDKGYTGTAEGTLTLPSYRLTVMLPDAIPEAWRDVVRSIEVWVTEEPDVLTGEAGVGLSSTSSGFLVGVTLVRRTETEVERMIRQSVLERMKRLDASAGDLILDIAREAGDGVALDTASLPEGCPERASTIASHGDRLYLATSSGIVSTPRGNPFLTADVSGAPGGTIRAIAAQPSGGGAYTRQYVYLFTDRGICALTHDNDGRHRTLRMVSQSVVRGRSAVAAVTDAVYALDESGLLVRLSDSKAVTAGRGFGDYDALAYERRFNELSLFRTGSPVWFTLSLDHRELRGSFRKGEAVQGMARDCGGRLYVWEGGQVARFESELAPEALTQWDSLRSVWPAGGAVRVSADLYCDEASLDLSLWAHGNFQKPSLASGVCLWRTRVSGGVNGPVWGGTLLPSARPEPRSLTFSMKGKVSRVVSVTVEPAGA